MNSTASNKMGMRTMISLLALASSVVFAQTDIAPAHKVLREDTTPRLVVKYKGAAPTIQVQEVSVQTVAGAQKTVAQRARHALRNIHTMANGAVVYHLGAELTLAEARAAAARIAADPTVEYAEVDIRVKASSVITADTFSNSQWPLKANTGANSAPGGADFVGAWRLSRGANVLVGVIDGGGLAHPDMVGQTVPGYDFISQDAANVFTTAGDGDGRDSDETDIGDYCTSTSSDSTWHGLKVASQIVALTGNNYGIAGAAYQAKVMHLRAIGRCGGFLSDVADALSWGVGVHIAGIPDNTRPIQVANFSLGGSAGTSCPSFMQAAIDSAISRKVPVIVAAGNDGTGAVSVPANCSGVIVVGAHTKSADLANYSNHSTSLTLTAAGGGGCAYQTVTCQNEPTVAASNAGTTTAGASRESDYFAGTSAAVPQVSAAVALMRALNMDLTPTEIKAALMASARKHAADSYCARNAGQCGAGMLDANAAVSSITFAPVLSVSPSYSTNSIVSNQSVTLTAMVSQNMGSSYQWAQTGGPTVVLTGSNTSKVTFVTPTPGTTLILKVTSLTATGGTLTAEFTVVVNNPPSLNTKTFSITAGTAANMALTASDIDGDATVIGLVDGPPGLTLNGNTLQWTASTAGSFNVTVHVTDARGLVSSETVVITVTAAVQTAQAPSSSSSGGGGSLDLGFIALMTFALIALKRKKA